MMRAFTRHFIALSTGTWSVVLRYMCTPHVLLLQHGVHHAYSPPQRIALYCERPHNHLGPPPPILQLERNRQASGAVAFLGGVQTRRVSSPRVCRTCTCWPCNSIPMLGTSGSGPDPRNSLSAALQVQQPSGTGALVCLGEQLGTDAMPWLLGLAYPNP